MDFEPSAQISSADAALESCENEVLAEVMQDHKLVPPPVSLVGCTPFAKCDEAELKLLDERMEIKTFAADETIIHTGANADELFFLLLRQSHRQSSPPAWNAGKSRCIS